MGEDGTAVSAAQGVPPAQDPAAVLSAGLGPEWLSVPVGGQLCNFLPCSLCIILSL